MSPDDVIMKIQNVPHLWHFWCPGCECAHPVDDSIWTFNGDTVRPTVSPSIRTRGGSENRVCHLFMRDGQLQFLGDCSHALAGKTVPMVTIDEAWK